MSFPSVLVLVRPYLFASALAQTLVRCDHTVTLVRHDCRDFKGGRFVAIVTTEPVPECVSAEVVIELGRSAGEGVASIHARGTTNHTTFFGPDDVVDALLKARG